MDINNHSFQLSSLEVAPVRAKVRRINCSANDLCYQKNREGGALWTGVEKFASAFVGLSSLLNYFMFIVVKYLYGTSIFHWSNSITGKKIKGVFKFKSSFIVLKYSLGFRHVILDFFYFFPC